MEKLLKGKKGEEMRKWKGKGREGRIDSERDGKINRERYSKKKKVEDGREVEETEGYKTRRKKEIKKESNKKRDGICKG